MKHLTIKIYGRVRGIGFRISAQNMALQMNITGFARNEEGGTVYIEAEGEEENLKQFLEWCKRGPLMAKVEKVESEFLKDIINFKSFNIFFKNIISDNSSNRNLLFH